MILEKGIRMETHLAPLMTRPGLLEAWLVLTSVKYHGNLYILIPLNQRLALTRLRETGPRAIASKLLLGKNNYLRRDAFWHIAFWVHAWTIKRQILTLEVFCWLGSKPLSNSYQCTYELSLSNKLWSLSKDRKKKMLSHYDCCKACW